MQGGLQSTELVTESVMKLHSASRNSSLHREQQALTGGFFLFFSFPFFVFSSVFLLSWQGQHEDKKQSKWGEDPAPACVQIGLCDLLFILLILLIANWLT